MSPIERDKELTVLTLVEPVDNHWDSRRDNGSRRIRPVENDRKPWENVEDSILVNFRVIHNRSRFAHIAPHSIPSYPQVIHMGNGGRGGMGHHARQGSISRDITRFWGGLTLKVQASAGINLGRMRGVLTRVRLWMNLLTLRLTGSVN